MTAILHRYCYAAGASWPGDEGWAIDPAVEVTSYERALGLAVGQASANRRYGRIRLPGATSTTDAPLPITEPSMGHYVRIDRSIDGGANWSPKWYGFCARVRRRLLGKKTGWPSAARVDYACLGLAALLGQVVCIDGYDLNASAEHPWPTYCALDFNAGGQGNMSAAPTSLHGRSCHVFALPTPAAPSASWTLAKAVGYLVAAFTDTLGSGGQAWNFVDTSTLGATILPPTAYHGSNLLQALGTVANTTRGVILQVSGGDSVTVTLRDAVPASGTTLDVSSSEEWSDVTIEDDTTACADHVLVVSSSCPTATVALGAGGDPAQIGPAGGWVFTDPPSPDPHNPAWRRWELTTTRLDDVRVELTQDGTGAYTYDRVKASAVGGGPSAHGLAAERRTGLRATQAGATPSILNHLEERGKPRLFAKRRSTGVWLDFSDKVQVNCADDPLSIELSGDIAYLYRWLDAAGGSGWEIRIILAVREMAPLRLSIRTTPSLRGERQVVRQISGVEQHYIPKDTPLAVAAGALVLADDDTITWEGAQTPMTDEVLRMAPLASRNSLPSVSLTRRGLHDDLPVGTLISAIDGGSGAISIQAIVTRERFNCAKPNRSTSWEAAPPSALITP